MGSHSSGQQGAWTEVPSDILQQEGSPVSILRCRCGQSLRIRKDHLGKRIFCARCGAEAQPTVVTQPPPFDVPAEPSTNAEPASAVSDSENASETPPRKIGRWWVIAASGLILLILLSASVASVAVWWNATGSDKDLADQEQVRLNRALSEGQDWLDGKLPGDGKVVENQLVQAMGDPLLTGMEEARSVLEKIVARRKERETADASVLAKQKAKSLWERANQFLEQGQASLAIRTLEDQLMISEDDHHQEAVNLLEEARVAISDSEALNELLRLDDVEFSRVAVSGILKNPSIQNPKLQEIYAETIRRNVRMATGQRDVLELRRQLSAMAVVVEDLKKENAELQRGPMGRFRPPAGAGGPSTLDGFLQSGDLAGGEQYLKALLDRDDSNDNVRFSLGILKFFRSIERLGQSLHHYGVRSNRVDIPFLRFPVEENPEAAPITYIAFRRILEDLSRDLQEVDRLLERVSSGEVDVPLRLAEVKLDLNSDGVPEGDLRAILKKMFRSEFRFMTRKHDVLVNYDRADVAWLRVYCNLLSGMLEFALAFDLEPLFDVQAAQIFSEPRFSNNPNAVALNQPLELHVVEPRRLNQARLMWINVCKLNVEMWAHIRSERDNRNEWLPNPDQDSALRIKTDLTLIRQWLAGIRELEALLDGRRTLPAMLGQRDGKRLNLRFFIENPIDTVILDPMMLGTLAEELDDRYYSNEPELEFTQILEVLDTYQKWFN